MKKNKYKYLKEEREKGIALLSLSRLPRNELNSEFMQEIIEAHQDIEQEKEIKAVILNSRDPKYFCNGMDPEYMLSQNISGRQESFALLFHLLETLYIFPKPHFSIIEGHAMAGGAFLALCSDFRYMADNRSRYCFSEAAINLTIPHSLLAIVREVVQPRYIRKLAQQAYPFRAKEALEAGLVDFISPPLKMKTENANADTELLKIAKRDMLRLLRNPLESLVSVKQNIRYPSLNYMRKHKKQALKDIEKLLSFNFEDRMKELLKRNNKQ